MTTIRLPWPARPLWQNARPHWASRAQATRKARYWAKLAAMEAGITTPIPNARLQFAFHPPLLARPDLANVPAAMKSYIDGIADAMGCDDRGFIPVWPEAFGPRVKLGAVYVTITKDRK
jgi:crossover junction endodeoxyribonuclease RusA